MPRPAPVMIATLPCVLMVQAYIVIVLPPGDQASLSFDAFFTHIVVHELMHGLGPHSIAVNGRQTTVRQELKETYSALEEAKADISGLFAIQHMIDKGVMRPRSGRSASASTRRTAAALRFS